MAILTLASGVHAQWLESTLPVGNEPVALCYNSENCKVYCACEEAAVVTVIDGTSNRILQNLQVGSRPMALCYGSLYDRIYCACYGSYSIWVIDGAADSVTTTIYLGIYFSVTDICYNPISNKVYCVSASNRGAIIDAETNRCLKIFSLPSGQHRVFHNPANNHVYFSSNSTDSLTVVDGVTDEILGNIPAGHNPYAFCYDSVHSKVFCGGRGGSVWVYDASSDSVIASLQVGASVWDVAYNQNRGVVYCANADGDELVLVDAATNGIIGRIPAGDGPLVVQYAAVDDRVYCADWFGHTVTVLDGTTDSLLTTIPVGNQPNALTWNPEWHRLCVSNWGSATVSVIRDSTTGITLPTMLPAHGRALSTTLVKSIFNWRGQSSASLFDGSGREIAKLQRGPNSVAGLPAGVYFIRDQLTRTIRVTIVR